ncbi:aldo/keto reductase [Phocaeicola sp.]
MKNISKLVLGTVQFGCNYGINNKVGQVTAEEVEAILKIANQNGIKTLDTSSAYGNSEIVLGNALQNTGLCFNIVSKYLYSLGSVKEVVKSSLEKLKVKKLYGYLIHHFEDYIEHTEIWDELAYFKSVGQIEKIGFSLYTPNQLQYLLNNHVDFDILQFPYNMFDRQFEPYMKELAEKGVEIHTRSAFLQGLFFKDIETFTGKFVMLKPYLKSLHDFCKNNRYTVEQLALGYCTSNPYIQGNLIGVDNHQQLLNNIRAENQKINDSALLFISTLNIKEKELLNPVNWK